MRGLTLQVTPELVGVPRVELGKEDFDNKIYEYGCDVIWDQTIICPCKGSGTQALSSCTNCRGLGWVVVKSTKTQMILQSINLNTQYKAWSEEKVGTVSFTALCENKTSFMDRITLTDSISLQSEILYPFKISTDLSYSMYTIYDIVTIKDIFVFVSPIEPLLKLIEDEDFVVLKNKITILNETLNQVEDLSLSIRYEYHPQFLVVDLNHDFRTSKGLTDLSQRKDIHLPISGIARRSHFVLGRVNDSTVETIQDNT